MSICFKFKFRPILSMSLYKYWLHINNFVTVIHSFINEVFTHYIKIAASSYFELSIRIKIWSHSINNKQNRFSIQM